jgi:ABC-type nitrate/sulfonate/bicarbonate transport system ATPase subunit
MIEAPSVEVEGVWKIYRSARHRAPLIALQDIDARIGKGRFVSIIGPSGCGKSTLLHVIHGLVRPSRGSVRVGGQAVQHPRNTPDLNRAMVFQDAMLLPWKTVAGNVAYGLAVGPLARKAVPREEIQERVEHYLQLTGLSGFERYYPHELSGGMKQRTNLARALVTHPEVLLMDEPFSALDAQTRELMQEELLRICAAESRTVVFITHDLEEALFLSDEILVMSSRPGRLLERFESPLPPSRDLAIKATSDFIELKRHLWSRLESEVRKTLAEGDSSGHS